MVEKTVVQPPFSRLGILSISEAALCQMIMHCIHERTPNVRVRKIRVDSSLNGYELEVLMAVPLDSSIPELLSDLQAYIVSNVERFSGIHIEELHLTVEEVLDTGHGGETT